MSDTPETPDISAPRLAATASIRHPTDRDAHEIKLTVNIITWDVDNLMDGMPPVFEPYLRDWLIRHTRTLTGLHEINGLEMQYAVDVKQLFEYHLDSMCHEVAKALCKEMYENVKAQLELQLPGLGARPVPSPRLNRSREDIARQLDEEADLIDHEWDNYSGEQER